MYSQIKSLCGLSRFPVLGSVSLGGNDLDWQELHHISRMTILQLSLLGNPKLDSDPHCKYLIMTILQLSLLNWTQTLIVSIDLRASINIQKGKLH